MGGLQIKIESKPKRCEICHQTDYFDPSKNFCKRCNDVNKHHALQDNSYKGSLRRYKDEEITNKVFSFLYKGIPIIIFVLINKILERRLDFPFAILISFIIGCGIIGYWIPKKKKISFPKYFALIALLAFILSLVSYIFK